MNTKLTVFFSLAILVLFAMLLFIVFSDRGLADLYHLKSERDRLLIENERLTRANLELARTIERLNNDPAYIESVARKELGMIRKEEIILTPSGGAAGRATENPTGD